MRKHTRRIQRVVFGMGMLAAMGFGAAQAVAAPSKAGAAAATCTSAERRNCLIYCNSIGGDGGFCENGQCTCY